MKYRLLRAGEVIRKGDEIFDNDWDGSKKWSKVPSINFGEKVLCFVGDWRRPLKSKEARKPASNKQRATCPH
jgi:hypothetical protein